MERQVTVGHKEGLHARPAAEFVKGAAGFPGTVELRANGKTANGRSLLSVLSLGVKAGDTVTLRVEGPEAADALERLVRLLEGP